MRNAPSEYKQSAGEAESLMEKQRLGDELEDMEDFDDIDQDVSSSDFCECGHTREEHVNYTDECTECDCPEFDLDIE